MIDGENRPLLGSFFQGGFESSSRERCDGARPGMIAATGHDRLAAADYLRLPEQGTGTARDGSRPHLIERAPGVYDFSSALPMPRAAIKTRMQILRNLLHYGWPDRLDIFTPGFVRRFASFARVFIQLLKNELVS